MGQDSEIHIGNQLYVMGVLSSLTTIAITHPIDTIRRNMQADSFTLNPKRKFVGIMDTTKKLVKRQGLFSLWRGLGITLLKTPPIFFSQIFLYENLKKSMDETFKY